MIHSSQILAAVLGLGSFIGSVAGPDTVLSTGLVLFALVALFMSARVLTEADLPLPGLAAALASLLVLVSVFVWPTWQT